MLREMAATKQRRSEPRRRWFYSDSCELVVWLDEADGVVAFQLAYDKDSAPHALTWKKPDEFVYAAIDSGETHPLKPKASPILVANGAFDAERIASLFAASSAELPPEYVRLVSEKIRAYPAR